MSRAYLCVTIDCERDKGPGWRVARPASYRGVTVGIGERLGPLFAARRVEPTWLLSPELLGDAACVDLLGRLPGELGTHLHGEYAEPGTSDPDVTLAVQRSYPEAEERAKLAWLTERFASSFGRRPRSFRAGRFGIGPHTLRILAELGYAVDSSVTPHVRWDGFDFAGAPTQPYRPAPEAPALPGDAPIWEVPVTIRKRMVPWAPPRWLRPTRASARALARLAAHEIAAARRAAPDRPIVLCAMLHNVEVVPGASPYAATEHAAARILAALDGLLAFAAREGIAGIGLGRVAEVLA